MQVYKLKTTKALLFGKLLWSFLYIRNQSPFTVF